MSVARGRSSKENTESQVAQDRPFVPPRLVPLAPGRLRLIDLGCLRLEPISLSGPIAGFGHSQPYGFTHLDSYPDAILKSDALAHPNCSPNCSPKYDPNPICRLDKPASTVRWWFSDPRRSAPDSGSSVFRGG